MQRWKINTSVLAYPIQRINSTLCQCPRKKQTQSQLSGHRQSAMMKAGFCFLIIFVQNSRSDPDTIVHVHIPPEPTGQNYCWMKRVFLCNKNFRQYTAVCTHTFGFGLGSVGPSLQLEKYFGHIHFWPVEFTLACLLSIPRLRKQLRTQVSLCCWP